MREEELSILQKASCQEFVFRPLEVKDHLQFIDALRGLTQVGEVSKTEFEQRYNKLFPAMADTYKILVIFDVKKQEVIGAGSLIIEHKFIRQLGTAGHIEDIVVKPGYRGKNLGLRLIEVLKQIAVVNGCYKVLLDCDEKNVKFYEKVSSRF